MWSVDLTHTNACETACVRFGWIQFSHLLVVFLMYVHILYSKFEGSRTNNKKDIFIKIIKAFFLVFTHFRKIQIRKFRYYAWLIFYFLVFWHKQEQSPVMALYYCYYYVQQRVINKFNIVRSNNMVSIVNKMKLNRIINHRKNINYRHK